jgi:hypothetical protein
MLPPFSCRYCGDAVSALLEISKLKASKETAVSEGVWEKAKFAQF